MRYTLDRIENGFAVLVDEQGVELIQPASAFNFPLREGMILEKTDAEDGFVLREDLQRAARERANELFRRAFKENK